ncbi:carboxypeptidase regulatory-like domain-containing protein [Acidicapsa ligni]|uniref:carboxypeptidase regulatory-like domain-containing protein n=1 Tax=Acidicapsa ligni TaxID=542300 RepID=UPI0021E0E908|nr:carboxypeptidase regulatory-like domain-containing protein [Acidicapsa ligni]
MRNTFTRVARCLNVALLGIFLLAVTNLSYGQDTNASLSGTVTDPSGAAIPGAKLTLKNAATSFQQSFESDGTGEYTFRNLTPGKYDLSVTATNFQSSVRTGIELAVNQSARIDVKLPLGKSDETVTVTGDASLINYDNPTIEGGVSPETLQDFPLVVSGAPRSSVTVAILMPGVSTGGGGNAYNARTNGGIVTGDEALVDGATASEGYMNQSGMVSLQTDFGMSPDITSEVKVLTANYDAQYGNSTSGQFIIQTKSGGEHFHGAAYEYLRNDLFNAAQYGAAAKPPDKENDYGANVGGPIWIPKYHSPSAFLKGYFYFNWEGYQDHGGANSSTLSIASARARTGDFSAAGSQLYYPNDPVKYGALAGTAIPNNQIDPSFEDPIAKAFLAQLPTPTNGNEINNYFIPKSGQGSLTNSENVYFWRIDMNVGQKDHLYYTYWWQYTGVNQQSDLPIALSTAAPASPENAPIQRLNWEHNFSSLMTNHATVGYLNRNEGYFALNGKAALPFVPGVANTSFLPEMTFGGGYSQLGNNDGPTSASNLTTRGTWAVNDVATRIQGKHTLSAGVEWKLAGTSIHSGENQGGTFNFAPDTTGNTACPSTAQCPGDAQASFYLGAVASANVAYINVIGKYPRQTGWAFHAGDSWRFNPKLTVSYGLRWDYISPFVDKHNNQSFIDPTGLNPDAITTSGTELPGRLAFAGTKWGAASFGGRYPEVAFKNAFAPRVGFAYTFDEKTVVRAGYGIYFGQAFYPGWGGGLAQDGFNKNLTISETTTGGGFKSPAIYLASGISASQVGQTQNISSGFDNGQQPSLYRPRDGNHRPYSSQWNLTIERQLPSNTLLSVSYVGTKGTHLPSALNPINTLNPFDPKIAGLGADLAVNYNTPTGPATFAKDGISQPYIGWASQMQACDATIAQALLPFPQYCGPLTGLNEQHGTSIYQSFQGKVERRLQGGLYILGSLTWQKMFTDAANNTQSQNASGAGAGGNSGSFSPFDSSRRAYALAPDNVPVTTSLALVYDLPFGKNKRFLNTAGFANTLLGGWQTSPIFRYEDGIPFSFHASSSCVTSTLLQTVSGQNAFRENCVPGLVSGQHPLLQGRNGFNPANTGGKLINAAAFESNFTTLGYTGVGKAVSNIESPSYRNLDIAFTKNTRIAEKFNFRFEANFFNAFNNHYFINQGDTNGGTAYAFVTDVAATGNSFGSWNGSVTTPRTIQFVGRFEF